jgi:hypothetical protein
MTPNTWDNPRGNEENLAGEKPRRIDYRRRAPINATRAKAGSANKPKTGLHRRRGRQYGL